MKETYPNKNKWGVRFRSPDISIAHLKMIIEKMPYIKYFNLLDSNINLKMDWYRKFMALYKEKIGIPMKLRTSPAMVDKEMLSIAKEAGCFRIAFGIEAGNEEYRKKILKRNVTQKQILEAFRLCKEYGIETTSFNMLGLLDETFENMLDTIKINAVSKVDIPTATIFYPFPNTPLYDLCIKKGYSIEYGKGIPNMGVDTILNQKTITADQVLFVHRCFRVLIICYQIVYKFPYSLKDIGEKILDRIFSYKLFPYGFIYKLHDKYFNQVYLSYLYRRSERHLIAKK